MKVPLIAKMPWDMVVFLTITTVGFGVAVNRLSMPGNMRTVAASSSEITNSTTVESLSRSGILTMEIGCMDRSTGLRNQDVSQGAVRLKGKFCDLTKNEIKEVMGSVKVKNITTGQESLIFISGTDAFVTDGIPLKTGKNIFNMEWMSKDVKKEIKAELYGR